MAVIAPPRRDAGAGVGDPVRAVGPIGRLGAFAADHVRAVVTAWVIVAIGLAAFAPKVETALSGAGWQADGSESVQARTLIQRTFDGRSSSALIAVVRSAALTTSAPEFQRAIVRVERILAADKRVASVQRPRPGASVSPDGHTAVVTAGASGDRRRWSLPRTRSS
jgi:RND superfamily putative drug exporter